jgi:glucose-6-phosphate isomerase
MKKLNFDFNSALYEMTGEHGFRAEEVRRASSLLKTAYDSLSVKSPGFRRLPKGQADILSDIEKAANDIRTKYKNFVVLGIGGSALGPTAVHQALSFNDTGIGFYVADNVDPEMMKRILELDPEKTAYNAISKSGQTSETMAQLMAVADLLIKKGLPLNEHIIVTTDEKKGNLLKIAQRENLKAFYIPADVGGRFSELCPVGLLPAAVCGFDIREMLDGAAYMDDVCSQEKNPAAVFALLHVLGMKRGMNISVMMPYADSLKYMSDWYAQLWAESLGKRRSIDGKEVFAGQTPVKALGVTDQHSQVQLYTEGPFDKIVTFLKVKKFRCDVRIPAAFEYIEDISFLGGKSFGKLLEAERYATEYALMKAGRPNITITLEEINEFTIGALLYFFEMATAYAGEMLMINAFDQPGVEEGKQATFALMEKKGYEEKKAEMEKAPARSSEWIF